MADDVPGPFDVVGIERDGFLTYTARNIEPLTAAESLAYRWLDSSPATDRVVIRAGLTVIATVYRG